MCKNVLGELGGGKCSHPMVSKDPLYINNLVKKTLP